MQEAPEPVPAAKAVKVRGAGSIVPRFGEGMTVEALATDHWRTVEVLQRPYLCRSRERF